MPAFEPKYAFPDGIDRIKRAADIGEPYAQWKLAHMMLMGDRMCVDREEALIWLKRAARQKFFLAHRSLAILYRDGTPAQVNTRRSALHFKMAADLADVFSQYETGINYLLGRGLAKNPRKGLGYLFLAAQNGCQKSLATWAWYIFSQSLIPASPAEACRFLERHHLSGDGFAAFVRGTFYQAGIGYEQKDFERARQCFEASTDLGYKHASRALGILLLNQDKDADALHHIVLAARSGDGWAQALAGDFYGAGLGTLVDIETSERWFTLALKSNLPIAKYFYAHSLCRNDPSEEDVEKAAFLLEVAARQGLKEAFGSLYHLYCSFHSTVGQNPQTVQWLRRAACIYGAGPMCLLSEIFEGHGNQDLKDNDLKLFWLQMAAEEQDPAALNALATQLALGDGCKVDMASTVALRNCAIELGSVDAVADLAIDYNFHRGLIQNATFAATINEYGATKGSEVAAHNLSIQFFHGDGVRADESRAQYWAGKSISSRIETDRECGTMSVKPAPRVSLGKPARVYEFKKRKAE